MNRREAIAAGTSAGVIGFFSSRSAASSRVKASTNIIHITDVHITNAREAEQGFAAMWDHVAQRKRQPEFVLNTGDAVMAIDGRVSGANAAGQIRLWKQGVNHVSMPIFSSLGNHDIWDGLEPTPETPAEKKGSALMVETLDMPAPYYSFDRSGWHFICLNSMSKWPDYGTLSDEQIAWLKADLKQTPHERPVCVFAHLPILSVTSSVYGDSTRKAKHVEIPGSWQQLDCWLLTEIFRMHPNVKLCLSGHMHTQDKVEYRGVHYICGGAVSGAWWNGSEYGFPPCYGAITLYPDGKFDYEFVDYGWKARTWRGKQLTDANGK